MFRFKHKNNATERSEVGNSGAHTRERAKLRYVSAFKLLQGAVQSSVEKDRAYEFGELTSEPNGFYDLKLSAKIETAFDAQIKKGGNSTVWGNCKEMVLCVAMAFSPIADSFRSVARKTKHGPVSTLYVADDLLGIGGNCEPVRYLLQGIVDPNNCEA